ncbi:hypothetical protein KC951_03250 [Candidatus Saccharibacteria bacterium]|nr:hypothetical protein [Candidatus Saccharibacteria bacterium]
MTKPSNNFSDMKLWEKLIMVCIFLFWIAVAFFFISYSIKENKRKAEYDKAYAIVEKECENKRVTNDDYSPQGAYDLYHDNGPQNPPVCRRPVTQKEVDNVIERRKFRQQLENGDIDPPSLDEDCYNARVCQ